MRIVAAIILGLLGYVAGYFAGAYYGCSGPNPSDLCGLLGAIIVGPAGGALGVTTALNLGRKA